MEDESAKPLIVLMHGDCKVSTKELARQIGCKKVEPWIELVDSMPTRFMLGSDTFRQDIDFDKVIAQLRRGLLANLQPASIELVANGNAKRIFKLTQ